MYYTERLKWVCDCKNITQKEIADFLNIKQQQYARLSGILFILIIINVFVHFNKINNDLEKVLQNKKYNQTISIMLETASESGEYEKTTASKWPTEGYVFNTELSRCENGSTLSWDDENNRSVMYIL